jgi:hypothetical protein
MRQSASNLFFEQILASFKIKNIVWLWHGILNFRA